MKLVADVGGTQSRLGLVQNGALNQQTIQRFTNADFTSFYDVIAQFLDDKPDAKISSCVVALAGPTTATKGRLTNLNWEISTTDLQQATHCDQAALLNDLTSLGYSLRQLPPQGTSHISGPQTTAITNGQHLVVGLGTGFNVCPVIDDGIGHPACLQVELGHTVLPHNIKTILNQVDAENFNTVEDIFSGKGLSNLHKAISGSQEKSGKAIVHEHLDGTNKIATQTLTLFAELLGLYTREMAIQYLPLSGIYFAGSVSRGLFGAHMTPVFEHAFRGQGHFLKNHDQIPMRLITDDAAGLLGCTQRSLIF